MPILSILLQAAPEAVQDTAIQDEGNHVLKLIWNADPVVQLSLLVLVFFSVVSWAIIFMKHKQLKQSKKRTQNFLSQFWKAGTIESLLTRGSFKAGAAVNVFKSGLVSLKEGKNSTITFIQKDIERQTAEEIEQLEAYVPFLATTASVAPFIGLFGTVWGILQAFWQIGKAGSSSLAVVGPYIAEALIATAVGLAAAIPAVIFYNFFVNKIRSLTRDLHQFSDDLTNRIDKEYLR